MPDYLIRTAQERDSAELARLSRELGYPASADVIGMRLQRLLTSADDVVFVAESSTNNELAGWIHGTLTQYLESDDRMEIAGLVVDERFRRQRIGRTLVEKVEHWGAERGVAEASVRCQTKRVETHQFYEQLGYRQVKMQIVFRKKLSEAHD